MLERRRLPRLRRLFRPVRERLAWLALVDEERSRRDEALGSLDRKQDRQRDELRDHLTALLEGVEERIRRALDELEARTARRDEELRERTEILLDELWRRLEAADARQATELQRLAERVDPRPTRDAGAAEREPGG